MLFLCSGNIMRSAFAELYARHVGVPVRLRSAGTTYRNSALHPATARALARRGVAAALVGAFQPTYLPAERSSEIGRGTVVFGMTRAHLADITGSFLLNELRGRHAEISDPIDHHDPGAIFDQVALCVDALRAALVPGAT